MKVFMFDSKKCNGCHNCQVACKDEHVGNDWYPYAKAQPNTGQFWLEVKQVEHGQIPMVKVEYTPWLCMHCEDCIASHSCSESAYIRRVDGLIYIDPSKCSGCRTCIDACPYDAVFFNEEASIAQKCTGCAHLVEKGELPHCVDVCAMDALRFGELEEFEDELKACETLLPERNTKPQVFYANRPGYFIGGEVWNPEENEVLEGAVVSLRMSDGTIIQQHTDDFGDFKFTDLKEGQYDLTISSEGFVTVQKEGINLQKSEYLGDFPLRYQ